MKHANNSRQPTATTQEVGRSGRQAARFRLRTHQNPLAYLHHRPSTLTLFHDPPRSSVRAAILTQRNTLFPAWPIPLRYFAHTSLSVHAMHCHATSRDAWGGNAGLCTYFTRLGAMIIGSHTSQMTASSTIHYPPNSGARAGGGTSTSTTAGGGQQQGEAGIMGYIKSIWNS